VADYFTHFSCVLDVRTPKKAVQALDLYTCLCVKGEASGDPEFSGFALALQDGSGTSVLWFHDDGQGDVEAVIAFVLRLAAEIDLTGLWGFDHSLCRIRHKECYAGIRIMPHGPPAHGNISLPSDLASQG
jgi:hypothetical protein